MAAAGSKRKVSLFNSMGQLVHEVYLPPAAAGAEPKRCCLLDLQWDPAGEQLALLPCYSSAVLIWTAATKEVQTIEADFKAQEVSCIAWSRTRGILAMGTSKGNLLLYATREKKKTPVLGKHTKRIVAGVWNKDNVLALTALDKAVTLSDGLSGETLQTCVIKAEPIEICVNGKKDNNSNQKEENTYTVLSNKRTLYLMQRDENKATLELAFQEHYGLMHRHLWFGDGYIMIGFRQGQVVVVSSMSKELSAEVHSNKLLDVLSDMAYSPSLGRVAVGGGDMVRVLDVGSAYGEIKSDAIELRSHQNVEKLGWSADGQVLSVGTDDGNICNYLAALPTVYAVHGNKIAYLTSLLEISVMDIGGSGGGSSRGPGCNVQLETEPAMCGLGPNHLAVAINNQVWYYRYAELSEARLVNHRTYLGSVQNIYLSEGHAAVLSEGRVIVHEIEVDLNQSVDLHDVTLPPSSAATPAPIACCSVSTTFVVTGSRSGQLCYYLLDGMAPVNDYRHAGGAIVRVLLQPFGTRLLFQDDKRNAFLFNPMTDQALPVPGLQSLVDTVLWDTEDPNMMVISDGKELYVYVNVPVSITGAAVVLAGKQALPAAHAPIAVANGAVSCRLKSGSISVILLETHRSLQPSDPAHRANPGKRLAQALALRRLRDAAECCGRIKSPDAWQQLAVAALEALDLELAVAAYRQAGNGSMVLSLQALEQQEDKHLLAAHVMVLLERDHAVAQELFLKSSRPLAALEMRKDLKHWPQALALAEQLDPGSIPAIGAEHAAMLETIGEYQQARAHYQQALEALGSEPDDELRASCHCGIARTTLLLGDLRQGRQLAGQINSPALWKECGTILEGMHQLQEAAEMFDRAGMYEKAASIYIQTKNFVAAAPLMAKVASPKLQIQFAKAKEGEGKYADAAAAYEAAGDLDNVVRLCLDKLNNLQKACALVRRTQSVPSAQLVAKHCLQAGDFKGAVDFLLMARQMDQAFDIAQAHGVMDTFAAVLSSGAGGAAAPAGELQRIAQYYESRGEYEKAADTWVTCEQDSRAVQLYLKVGTPAALHRAIALVDRTKSSSLGTLVMDFITACDAEEHVKDDYRFRLNIALGHFMEAARDAVELARFEQEEGAYKVAHGKLFSTCRQLEGMGIRPPQELVRALMLLHSYILVKSLVAIDDHVNAARMLVRVARNISKFPKHVVPILTSTVIECARAGMKKTAFEYAAMLMRPEYRNDVDPKHRKKIELMVRKPDRTEETEEQMLDCPHCSLPGPETELQCVGCQNIIPFDIATGKRMTLMDWYQCPSCHHPCSEHQFTRLVQATRRCPLCNDEVNLEALRRVTDPSAFLRRQE